MPHKRAKNSVRAADRKSKGKDLAPTTQDVLLRDMPKGAMRILNGAKIQEEHNRRKKERAAQLLNGGHQSAKKAKGGETAEPLRIKPGEKMAEFSSRVEREMAGEVHATFKRATNKKRKRKAGEEDGTETDAQTQRLESAQKAAKRAEQEPDSKSLRQERARLQSALTTSPSKATDVDRDWQKAAQRKSVNDVVDAPPTLTRAPRGQSSEALKRKAELKQLMQGGDVDDAAPDAGRGKARLPNPVQQLGMRRQAELQQERDKAVKAYREAKERRLHEAEKAKAE